MFTVSAEVSGLFPSKNIKQLIPPVIAAPEDPMPLSLCGYLYIDGAYRLMEAHTHTHN